MKNPIVYIENKKTKAVVIVLIVLTLLVISVVMIRKIQSLVKAWKVAQDNKSEQQILAMQGQSKTHPQSWFVAKSSSLLTALKGPGTDEDTVYAIFQQLNNDLDFLELFSVFGIRDGYTLQEWLDGDLSSSEKNKINSAMYLKGLTKSI